MLLRTQLGQLQRRRLSWRPERLLHAARGLGQQRLQHRRSPIPLDVQRSPTVRPASFQPAVTINNVSCPRPTGVNTKTTANAWFDSTDYAPFGNTVTTISTSNRRRHNDKTTAGPGPNPYDRYMGDMRVVTSFAIGNDAVQFTPAITSTPIGSVAVGFSNSSRTSNTLSPRCSTRPSPASPSWALDADLKRLGRRARRARPLRQRRPRRGAGDQARAVVGRHQPDLRRQHLHARLDADDGDQPPLLLGHLERRDRDEHFRGIVDGCTHIYRSIRLQRDDLIQPSPPPLYRTPRSTGTRRSAARSRSRTPATCPRSRWTATRPTTATLR